MALETLHRPRISPEEGKGRVKHFCSISTWKTEKGCRKSELISQHAIIIITQSFRATVARVASHKENTESNDGLPKISNISNIVSSQESFMNNFSESRKTGLTSSILVSPYIIVSMYACLEIQPAPV